MSADTKVYRSIQEPIRVSPSWDECWKGCDGGLITCWEKGRELAQQDLDLAQQAQAGELPVLGWRGGVERATKKEQKYGSLFYLAQWQGLRGDDLAIDRALKTTKVCTKTGMTVIFTSEVSQYDNA